ncbi:hypothetical protein [Paraburkholderia franconis]|uniref:hypothetical protein n=1 Tax=Paraburkholderia franconis TaxID=2654983 RepID=UPI00187B8E24|nr:hypothetical protein [Paraburkholderia franconis]
MRFWSNAAHVDSLDNVLKLVERGDFELVAIVRGMLVNADWANKVRDGRIDLLTGKC